MTKLLPNTDKLLKTPTTPWDFENPPFDVIEYVKEMVRFMRDHQGLGLASNQIETAFDQPTIRYSIFSMHCDPNIVCINPRIIDLSGDEITLEEGCLSYPGLSVKIKRHQHLRARYQQPNGETVTETYTGMTARVFQHEMDHLDGINFLSRANRFHREQAMRKAARIMRRR